MLSSAPDPGVAIECQILRVLCLRGGLTQVSAEAARRLGEHSWRAPEHRTIFEAIVRLSRRSVTWSREELAAEATRMGFPDIDWNEYFDSSAADREPAGRPLIELLEELARVPSK